MSIKTQKALRFIPFVNFLTMFFWLRTCIENNVKHKYYFKGLLLISSLLIVTFIPEILIEKYCTIKIITTISHYVFTYIQLFLIAHIAVKEQEKIAEKTGE